jgi:signal transduction histidine kinase
MGTHGASMRPRALPFARHTDKSTDIDVGRRRSAGLSLTSWPVARRLFAVIVAALLMGLIFGGLRVADGESSAGQFDRTQQLAKLNTELVGLVDDLQNERDTTLLLFTSTPSQQHATMAPLFAKTDAAIARVKQAASSISGLPANIQADIAKVLADINPSGVQSLRASLGSGQNYLSAIASYGTDVTDMTALADQTAQGVSDASLSGDVQALNALALAKEQVSQQRALLNSAFSSPANRTVTYNGPNGTLVTSPDIPTADPGTEQALAIAYGQQYADLNAFYRTAGSLPAQSYTEEVSLAVGGATTGVAQEIEDYVFLNNGTDYFINDGKTDTRVSVPGSQLIPTLQSVPLEQGPKGGTLLQRGLATWDKGMGDEFTAMQSVEMQIAGDISSRAGQLRQSAQQSAFTSGIITVVVLLVVLFAALVVARSLVLPLRRLRAGALDIATVQLPERVGLLTESPDAAESMEVVPINVASQDEIGQVARAFDQVHSEAVRLAGEQALLRSTFNAMFVNLSRRSQTLIERLARMIDTQEQSEDDPDRLSGLFFMDHLVTRMRRNSENLLLLAGHENPRKWSEAVPLADVARAATSEIEQYNRVALNMTPGVSVIGQAVSDVVHLLAELIENATIFSPKDTQVHVRMQELTSGGALIEIIDRGIGVSDERLNDMNWRLDNPPTIDVSVSRHMGLFAVARLAGRHRVRVRLRPATPQGLSALVWLPDSVLERTSGLGSGTSGWSAQSAGARAQTVAGEAVALTAGGQRGPGHGHATVGGIGNLAPEGRTASGWFRGGHDGAGRLPAGSLGGPDAGWSADGGTVTDPAGPSRADQTATGLPVRVPKANLPPGTGGAGPAGGQPGLPARSPGGSRPQGTGRGSANGGALLPQRSPEQARSRLAGFQRGTRRAEGQGGSGGQPQRAGEGTLS